MGTTATRDHEFGPEVGIEKNESFFFLHQRKQTERHVNCPEESQSRTMDTYTYTYVCIIYTHETSHAERESSVGGCASGGWGVEARQVIPIMT